MDIMNSKQDLFQVTTWEHSCVGVNEKAEQELKQLWPEIEAEIAREDDKKRKNKLELSYSRFYWVFHVTLLPSEKPNEIFITLEEAKKVAEWLCQGYEFSCTRFMYEAREACFVVLLKGMKDYTLEEAQRYCATRIDLPHLLLSCYPIRSADFYDGSTKVYMDFVEKRCERKQELIKDR